jgi:hypothetical protein
MRTSWISREEAEHRHRTQIELHEVRNDALGHAIWYMHHSNPEATPEQILSVAAKFEAYLTAPETVLNDSLNTR